MWTAFPNYLTDGDRLSLEARNELIDALIERYLVAGRTVDQTYLDDRKDNERISAKVRVNPSTMVTAEIHAAIVSIQDKYMVGLVDDPTGGLTFYSGVIPTTEAAYATSMNVLARAANDLAVPYARFAATFTGVDRLRYRSTYWNVVRRALQLFRIVRLPVGDYVNAYKKGTVPNYESTWAAAVSAWLAQAPFGPTIWGSDHGYALGIRGEQISGGGPDKKIRNPPYPSGNIEAGRLDLKQSPNATMAALGYTLHLWAESVGGTVVVADDLIVAGTSITLTPGWQRRQVTGLTGGANITVELAGFETSTASRYEPAAPGSSAAQYVNFWTHFAYDVAFTHPFQEIE